MKRTENKMFDKFFISLIFCGSVSITLLLAPFFATMAGGPALDLYAYYTHWLFLSII